MKAKTLSMVVSETDEEKMGGDAAWRKNSCLVDNPRSGAMVL